jgi:GT2 family glycosyltransferase
MNEIAAHAIVVAWNKMDDTVACIESLLNGTRPPDRIVVVDNGSNAGVVAHLRQFCGGQANVSLIENDANYGYTRGANIGIQYAMDHEADAILLINDDAVLGEDALEILLEAAREEDGIGLFGPRILHYDEPEIITEGAGRFSIIKGAVIGYENMKRVAACSDTNREVPFLTGCVLMIRSRVFEKIGLFDEDFFMYAEDVDFCFRARKAGARLLHVPRAQAMHKVPFRVQRHLSRFALYHQGRSNTLILRKHFRHIFLIAGLCSRVFMHAPYTLLRLLRGAGEVRDYWWWLKGTWDGMWGHAARRVRK